MRSFNWCTHLIDTCLNMWPHVSNVGPGWVHCRPPLCLAHQHYRPTALLNPPSCSPLGLTKHATTRQLHAMWTRWRTHVLHLHARGHVAQCMPPLSYCATYQFFYIFYKSCHKTFIENFDVKTILPPNRHQNLVTNLNH